MVYGVVAKHDTDDYSKITMSLWSNGNASYLMNKGCEAVFIDEMSARVYAYEQSKIRKTLFDTKVHEVS